MSILKILEQKQILLSDGAWGTFLQATGLKPGECPELWNITRKNDVIKIAQSYIEAGSDIIETNSFGGSIFKLSQYGLGDRVFELNKAAAAISSEAAGKNAHVAGSVGPTGKMLIMGDVTEEELYNGFKEQCTALEAGGADIIIIETMSAIDEASAAIKAARENTGCVVIATMTFDGDIINRYHTMMGVTPSEMVVALKEAGAHIIGSNCGNGIENMIGIVKEIRKADKEIPVMIQANAGAPELIEGKTVFRESPEMMASYVPALVEAGVNIIGGCCGTTPAHIRELRKVLGK
ncbi:MAG TPA: homocysteine S-methyltransferase family protein [Bacteroidales bacterium]|nr:homocysteine S-methyltransferase family protein [Bacteroidales bacterium]